MIQTILLTVLFTLLGVGVVILLVWLSVTSWKTKKLSKENAEMVEAVNNSLTSNVGEILTRYDDQIKRIDAKIDDGISTAVNNLYSSLEEEIKGVLSKVDSRFDKMERKNEVKQVLKFGKTVWEPVENDSVENGGDKSWNLTSPEQK
jgi:methionyl-tRNA synthetase